ncbi:MAG: hypothetical protein ACTSP4_00740 [Candidatus Hodarchaeales archaeon]
MTKKFQIRLTRAVYEESFITVKAKNKEEAKDQFYNKDIDFDNLEWEQHSCDCNSIELDTIEEIN